MAADLAEPDRDRARERFMMHLIAVADAVRLSKLELRFRAIGLTVAKHRVLSWLGLVPGASMSEIAAGCFVDRTTLTRVIDQLVDQGHVTRLESPSDRRKVLITATRSGEALVRLGDLIIDELNETVAGVVEPEVVRATNRALLKLLEALVPDEQIRAHLTGPRTFSRSADT